MEGVTKHSSKNTRKRKGAASDFNEQESSNLATTIPVVVTKKSKKQTDQNSSIKTLSNCEGKGSIGLAEKAKNSGRQSLTQQKNRTSNILFEALAKKRQYSESVGKERKTVSSSSPQSARKAEKHLTSASSIRKPASNAKERLSSEPNLSQSKREPKVRRLEKDKTRNDDKIKTPLITCHKNTKSSQSRTCDEDEVKNVENQEKDEKGKSQIHDKYTFHSKAVDASDPMAMLMMMEGNVNTLPEKSSVNVKPSSSSLSPSLSLSKPSTSKPKGPSTKRLKKKQVSKVETEDSSGSEGLSDWEDVHDHPESQEKSQVPDGPVEITLDLPDILRHKKRKKKEFDWKGYLERRVRRFKKEVAMDMHKVHLLCMLSLGLRQNEELNDLTLSGQLMSIMPAHLASVVNVMDSSTLERRVEAVLAWYKKTFSLEHIKLCTNIKLVLASAMEKSVSERVIKDARVWVLVFICILRTLGLSVRLVLSFHAMPYKVSQDQEKPGPAKSKSKANAGPSKPQAKNSKSVPSSSSSKAPKTTLSKDKIPSSQTRKSESKKGSIVSRKRLLRVSSDKAKKKLRESVEDSEDNDKEDKNEARGKKERKKVVETKGKKLDGNKKNEDEDFHGKILSASSSEAEDVVFNRSTIAGHDFWLEIYFPVKKRWICFDAFKSQFGKPYSLENSATQPLTYVVAFKNDGGVKDVTARYAKLWMSHTCKQRADNEWWEESLGPFNTTPHNANMEEDDEIKGQLLVRPMPTSIADLKNHPLYAMRRHLLKFEAIYPDTAIPLGYIKQEPIYARECVHTLHSRDNWLKEGRMVRLAEQPYKMVKSRPKWNKPKDNPDELDLELYGEWQTEKYIPPPAVNGKVPKNEYGNLELFKPWMLPIGTVQLKVNGLQRIAKKLGIDVAPAMVGWDHHSGHSHPVFDGVVVCEEHADTLMVAWTEDQEIQEQRETEKREKRVYGNWRLLIRGLLIKSRLTEKFSQVDLNVKDKKERLLKRVEELKKQEEQEEEIAFADAEPALDVQHSWPRRQQDEVNDKKAKDTKIKIEEARNMLEKGIRRGKAFKEEIACQAKGSKGLDGKGSTDNDIAVNIIKCKENRKIPGRNAEDSKKQEGGEKQNKGVKNRTDFNKRKNVKSSALQRRQRRKELEEEGSDTEEDFSDEVDGESKTAKRMTSRPKRRSVTAVKYFDSDEGGEDFIDDSDGDSDFEQVKKKHRRDKKKIRTDDGSEDGLMNNTAIKKKDPETTKPIETRHWLDEEGSSSDENDFVPVEPEDSSLSHMIQTDQAKEILIGLNEDKNMLAKLVTPERETSISRDELEKSKEISQNKVEIMKGERPDLCIKPQIEDTCAQKPNADQRKRNKKHTKISTHKSTISTQSTSPSLLSVSGKGRGNANKLLDETNNSEDTSNKTVREKSKDSKKIERITETNGNRRSLRITRQTS
ncbi:hypothetical protein RRG08_036329 [Elysia crispata]|uniref:Uncharacterized protein n=1 Tax=Elysia crispata TaxID=231223 RepID=A0AAE1DKC2_9GAST|nr:hypothetical protein RRG08_036329 [Elysia crispata]